MSATISVVLSVYNGAEHLAETLDSILAQTERDFELIVVDDGSTDATPAILQSYAGRDGRVHILRQENRGLTRALIAGCAVARGAYIARHDTGDTSHPERLAKQRRMLDASPELAFVSCATQYVGPEGEPLWITRPSGAAMRPAHILGGATLLDGPTHHGSVVFRRDAYERAGGYRAAFRYGQDFDLWYRLAAEGKFQSTADVLYVARITPESISGTARAEQELLASLSSAALEARTRGESDDAILVCAAQVQPVRSGGTRRSRAAGLYLVGEALRRNRDPRAKRYLRRAIATWPFSPRAWLRMAQSLIL
ncbi:MAG TPA: glycosyltransferase [Thermoanaerobaculia bacterium]|nr:glycosyltransferase [Thermoanaerobaculia bacterium]